MFNEYSTYYHDNGDKLCYKNGQLHCSSGPAVITGDGYELWYAHGVLHRADGPAYIGPCGLKEYWLSGYQYDEHQFIEILVHRMQDLDDQKLAAESSRNCVNRFLTEELRTSAQLRLKLSRSKRRAFAVRKQSLFWRGLANRCADIGAHLMKESQKRTQALVKEITRTEVIIPVPRGQLKVSAELLETCNRCFGSVKGDAIYLGRRGPYCSDGCARDTEE